MRTLPGSHSRNKTEQNKKLDKQKRKWLNKKSKNIKIQKTLNRNKEVEFIPKERVCDEEWGVQPNRSLTSIISFFLPL